MKKTVLFIIVILLSFTNQVWAQPPYSACFTANTYRGCAPLTVTITSCSQSGPGVGQPLPSYLYDFANNPGATPTQVTTTTYNTPGTYVIQQTVNDGVGFTTSSTDVIEVLGKPDPVYTVQACAGLLVRVVITDTNYDSFLIDFGDGNSTTVTAGTHAHTYTSASNFTINVTGQYSIACTGASLAKPVTTFGALVKPDIIDLTVAGVSSTAGSIDLRYNSILDRLYRFEAKTNNGAYTFVSNATASASGISKQTLTSLNTQANTYTYRIQNIDACGNSSAYSDQIASILISTSILNGSNQITFSSNGGLAFTTLDINKNTSLLQANASSPYNDNSIVCGTDYCYQIQGSLPTISSTLSTNHKSYSYLSCVKGAFSGTIPTVSNLNSTVEGNNAKIVWDSPTLNPASAPIDFYSVYRDKGTGFENYGSATTTSFLDNQANINGQTYCYQLSYKDPCNSSISSLLSLSTCTVYLTVSRTDETNNLSWTPYIGYQSGIKEYIVENLDLNGNIVLSKSAGLNTSYSETADQSLSQIIYRIRVIANSTENIESISNTVTLDLTPQIFMPNVFTPNQDGDNDILEVKGKYFKSVKMTILNKWGEVIFISEDYKNGWDGTYKGNPAPIDSYAYHVVALDNLGEEISLKGVVSLIR